MLYFIEGYFSIVYCIFFILKMFTVLSGGTFFQSIINNQCWTERRRVFNLIAQKYECYIKEIEGKKNEGLPSAHGCFLWPRLLFFFFFCLGRIRREPLWARHLPKQRALLHQVSATASSLLSLFFNKVNTSKAFNANSNKSFKWLNIKHLCLKLLPSTHIEICLHWKYIKINFLLITMI